MKKNPVFVWQKRALKKIYSCDIYCLATERNYTNFFLTTASRPLMVRCTLDSALKILPADEFIKIHRSYAVSIKLIDEIGRDLVKIEDQEVPLSRQYYKSLIGKLPIIGRQMPPAQD